MPPKAEKVKETSCPECKRNALYVRKDGSKRCMRCGYDSRKKKVTP